MCFSLGVTKRDKISNEYIRWTAHVCEFGDKAREVRLRCFGHVQWRDEEYVGRRRMEIDPPHRRK